MIVIDRIIVSGFDWHDMEADEMFLKKEDSYFFQDRAECLKKIAGDIKEIRTDEDFSGLIQAMMTGKDTWEQPQSSIRGIFKDDEIEIFIDREYETRISYIMKTVTKPKYLICEQYGHVNKEIFMCQRFYHEPFEDMKEAAAYFDSFEVHEGAKKVLLILNEEDLEGWYEYNMEVIALMKEKGVNHMDDSYSLFCDEHIENLKKI